MQWMRWAKGGALALCTAGAAIALSGCVDIKDATILSDGQSMGPAILEVDICASKVSVCNKGTSGLEAVDSQLGQVLVGLNLAEDYSAPAEATSRQTGGPVLTQSPSYSSALQALAPAGPGRKWVGYVSNARTFTPGSQGTFAWTLPRPLSADGGPAPSTVSLAVVAGSRVAGGDFGPSTRPVQCVSDNTVCADASINVQKTGFRDLALTPGPTATARPGETVSVPVVARFAGIADPVSFSFRLAATSTLPGATLTPSAVTFTPGTDSTTSLPVSVSVPTTAAPGTYGVTLTASLTRGETRSGTGTLVVPAPAGTTASPAVPGTTGTPGSGPGTTGSTTLCAGQAATIVGTAGPDTLRGTPGVDVIAGLGGDDTISGLAGDDLACGGPGADRVAGGPGADRLVGGAGSDRLAGGPGPDALVGGPGADRLVGGGGLDALSGGVGRNVLVQ